jgi:hypothetical protein
VGYFLCLIPLWCYFHFDMSSIIYGAGELADRDPFTSHLAKANYLEVAWFLL